MELEKLDLDPKYQGCPNNPTPNLFPSFLHPTKTVSRQFKLRVECPHVVDMDGEEM